MAQGWVWSHFTDKENNTIETYDSESVTGTPILTQTMSSDEQEVTWTPS